MKALITASILALPLFTSALRAQDGSDINKAIPVYFGQTIEDTIDSKTRAEQVYAITMARGQELTVVATNSGTSGAYFWLYLLAPATPAISRYQNFTVASDGGLSGAASRTFKVTASAAGTYYIWIGTDRASGVKYSMRVIATGTPIAVPNPVQAGCLLGRVDYITYSLQLIAAGLPDEVSIGGVKACTTCQVKAPLYPELASRIENALRSKVNVEACYDGSGNIFQLKLVQP